MQYVVNVLVIVGGLAVLTVGAFLGFAWYVTKDGQNPFR